MKTDYTDIRFKENGKLKLLIIVGTRPEIIRLSAVITKCRKYFDCILAHTGQNYDYNLNGVFFKDLKLADPEVYMDAVGDDLGETVGNIINCAYKLMSQIQPDALLILGDTNSCLSAIAAKRLHIPIFHMEAGNRCKDECLPEETNRRIVDIISDVNLAYSEHARKYLHECGLPKERTYVTGSPMAEVLHQNLEEIEKSDILEKLGLEPGRYMLLSACISLSAAVSFSDRFWKYLRRYPRGSRSSSVRRSPWRRRLHSPFSADAGHIPCSRGFWGRQALRSWERRQPSAKPFVMPRCFRSSHAQQGCFCFCQNMQRSCAAPRAMSASISDSVRNCPMRLRRHPLNRLRLQRYVVLKRKHPCRKRPNFRMRCRFSISFAARNLRQQIVWRRTCSEKRCLRCGDGC